MAVEPSQEQVTHHFLQMARGMVTDEDIQSLGRRNKLGGHTRGRSVNYRMMYPNTLAKPPVQNVTSDITSTIDQAKSRLGRAIKLDSNLDNEPVVGRSHKRRHRSSSKKGGGGGGSSRKRRRKSSSCEPDQKKRRRSGKRRRRRGKAKKGHHKKGRSKKRARSGKKKNQTAKKKGSHRKK